jgi:hypothetical protein
LTSSKPRKEKRKEEQRRDVREVAVELLLVAELVEAGLAGVAVDVDGRDAAAAAATASRGRLAKGHGAVRWRRPCRRCVVGGGRGVR